MSNKTPRKLTGRATVDENGNRTWTWHSDDQVDTATVRALGEELSLDMPEADPAATHPNPYDRPLPAPPEGGQKRRTLDDMRRLSEHIKKAKQWKRER